MIVGLIFDLSLELRGLASAVNNNNYVTSAVLVTFAKPGQKSSTLAFVWRRSSKYVRVKINDLFFLLLVHV